MNLYEINQQLIDTLEYECDIETGEILEGEQLTQKVDEIEMVLSDKMENIACYIKNLESDVEALKKEKDNIAKRQKSAENKIKWLKNYLSNFMQMNEIPKFETSKCKVTFRKSRSIEVTNLDVVPKEYIKDRVLKETDVNKGKLKKWFMEHGENETISGVNYKENINMQIK